MVFPFKYRSLVYRQSSAQQWGWLVAFGLLLASLSGWAQSFPLQVQVSVLPPYSAYLQDYPGAGQQVRVFIINTSRQTYQIRLAGQLTGDNGVVIRTAAGYRPPRPLTVPPGQTLLSRSDLEGLFDLNQVEVTGIDKTQLARGLPLPDGQYQLCIRAFSETPTNTAAVVFGQPLSAEFPIGCSAPIAVRSVEPPILITPGCDAAVTATNPQALVFTWTPPAGVSPALVEYTLRVVELPQVDVDPNVFIDAVALPRSGVEVRGLRTSTFLYGPTQPPLQLGRRYAWRVQAIDRSGKLHFLNDGKAPVCPFTYGTVQPTLALTPGQELVQTPTKLVPMPGPAVLATTPTGATAVASVIPAPPVATEQKVAKSSVVCKAVSQPDNTKLQTGPLDGKTVKLGEFELTIATATSGKAGLSGTGRVSWQGAPIKVVFTDLQVNTDNQVINGTVTSDSKGPGMPTITPGSLSSYSSLPPDYFDKITNSLTTAAKQAIAVPLPIKYDGTIGTIGINQMTFSPVGAMMDLVLGVPIPEANGKLLLAATEVCTRPSQRIPDNGVVYLVQDFTVPGIGQTLTFRKKDPEKPGVDGTQAQVKNGDFEKVHAVVSINLGSKVLRLDDGQGGTKAGDVVSTVTTDFVSWSDWIGKVELPPFQLPLLSGVTFSGNEVLYDHSSVRNVDGFSLPDDYKDDKGPTFEGVYFKKLTVQLPKSLKDSPRISIGVNGGVVNGSGFTGVITSTAAPVLDYKKENIAGFGFGIDQIQWTIVQNSNRGGFMLGQLQFPISTDAFSYSCNLSGGFDKLQFTASPKDGYAVPLFAATMDLNANTSIDLTYTAGKGVQVGMKLAGKVSINVKKFAGSGTTGQLIDGVVPKLCFQDFQLRNATAPGLSPLGAGLYASTGNWQLDTQCAQVAGSSPPKGGGGPWSPDDLNRPWETTAGDDSKPALAGFPLDFDPPAFITAKEGAGIRLGVGLHLGEVADDKSMVQAHGSVDVLGSIGQVNGRFSPVYKGTYPRSFSLAGGIGPLKVTGEMKFFNTDATYGDGLKGSASVTIPNFDVTLKMMLLFGNVQGFHYGFVDGSAQFPGIPIVGPIRLTGLGGGMHYNMRMTVGGQNALADPTLVTKLPKATNDLTTPPTIDLNKPGQTMSGAVFVPDKGHWGLTAKVYAGLVDPKVFNASLALTMDFSGGSLWGVSMHGNANVISQSGDGDAADGVVHALMDITYADKELDAGLQVDANFLTASVKIPFHMHVASAKDWFIKLGDPQGQRISVVLFDLNKSIVKAHLGAEAYLVAGVGPNVGGLPPVPAIVDNFLTNGANTLASAKAAYQHRSMPNLMPIGNNFKLLLGGKLEGDFKVEVEPFRFSANAVVGFDAALAQNMACAEGGTPDGVKGWYGEGRAYVYLGGKVDLFVDTWFFSGSLTLMKLEAGALLQAGLPKPAWAAGRVKVAGEVLDGLISVSTTQDFALGDKCSPVYNGDPLKDIEIISEITPATNETDVSTLPTMAVAFNMPMNKVFEVYVSSDDIRYYQFRAAAPVITMTPPNGSATKLTELGPVNWAADYRSYTVSATAYQPSFATVKLTQSVSIKEMNGGQYGNPVDPMNYQTGQREPRSQQKESSFTLGKQPDEIPLETITRTWPINGQQYFLKSHQPTGLLTGKTLKGLDILKAKAGEQLSATFETGKGERLTVPLTYDGENTLTFPIPATLKNQTAYRLTLGRQAKPAGSMPGGPLTKSQYVTLAQSPKVQLYRTTFNAGAVQAAAAANQANQQTVYFSLQFATSQFNTFEEKLAALNLKASDYKYDREIYLSPAAGTYERFDRIDLFNNTIYPSFVSPRLLNYETPIAGTPYANTPYEKEVRTRIYDKLKLLAEDGSGSYTSAGAGQGVSADFRLSTLSELTPASDPYDREAYNDPNGTSSVGGVPQRVLFLTASKAAYNPLKSELSWRFVRDKLAYWDLVALSGILDALQRLNYLDVLGGKTYSPDKNLNDQAYMALHYHDPNAESGHVYEPTFYSEAYIDGNGKQQPPSSWPNPSYRKVDGAVYDEWGHIRVASPYKTLIINSFSGALYRKKTYWTFAEDSYYKLQAYTDDTGKTYGDGPVRDAKSPFRIAFKYGSGQSPKVVNKTFTIGSQNAQGFTPIPYTPYSTSFFLNN
ncbi:hypothetical protein GCM10027578_07040 [Spirosoma luteolum]